MVPLRYRHSSGVKLPALGLTFAIGRDTSDAGGSPESEADGTHPNLDEVDFPRSSLPSARTAANGVRQLILRPHGKQISAGLTCVSPLAGWRHERQETEAARSVGIVAQRLHGGVICRLNRVTGNPQSQQRGVLDLTAGVTHGLLAG